MSRQAHQREATVEEFTLAFNQQLLQIKVLLQNTDEAQLESVPNLAAARRLADQAVALSAAYPKLHAKAHLFLGHVLRADGRWLEAHQAYVRAAPVCHQVGRLTAEMLAAYNQEVEEEKTQKQKQKQNQASSESELRGKTSSDRVHDGQTAQATDAQPAGEAGLKTREGPPVLRRVKGRYFDNLSCPDFYLDI